MFPVGLTALDLRIEAVIDSARSAIGIEFWSWITTFGDSRTITVVALALAFVLWRHRRFAYKTGFAVALFGSIGTSYALKLLIERPRPLAPLALINEPGYSFPSMHAAVSMATYGFLAYLLWHVLQPKSHRAPAVIALITLIGLIGFSRVYLGVHYATDVLGGYLVGAVFIWIGARVTRALSAQDPEASIAAPFVPGGRSRLGGNTRRAANRQPRA